MHKKLPNPNESKPIQNADFEKAKKYIENQLKEINEGRATYLTQEEFEKKLNEIC
jgi:hypothetical protein